MTDVFSKESLQFLSEVRLRNSREWYADNKETYERVLLFPFEHLVSKLSRAMFAIDPKLELTPGVSKTISRLNRDIRFSRDKSLYRDTMWLKFARRTKESNDYPAFFFEINPHSYRYGMGFFSASLKTMDLYRDAIAGNELGFIKLINDMEKRGIFVPEGESYKKNKYNGSNEKAADWYNRKNIYMAANREDVEEIFDFEKLYERLENGFKSLADFYLFLTHSVVDRYVAEGTR